MEFDYKCVDTTWRNAWKCGRCAEILRVYWYVLRSKVISENFALRIKLTHKAIGHQKFVYFEINSEGIFVHTFTV